MSRNANGNSSIASTTEEGQAILAADQFIVRRDVEVTAADFAGEGHALVRSRAGELNQRLAMRPDDVVLHDVRRATRSQQHQCDTPPPLFRHGFPHLRWNDIETL